MTNAAHSEPLKSRQAHVWKRDEHDFYLEESWCSERLFANEVFEGSIWDPACGTGRIVHAAKQASLEAIGSDIVDRSGGYFPTFDFLEESSWATPERGPNIVSNPPFKLAEKFVRHALDMTTSKVAMLLPLTWLSGEKRSQWLEESGLRRIWILTPRPSMPPGAVIAAGEKPGGGLKDFAWYIWLRGYDGAPEIRWLRRDG